MTWVFVGGVGAGVGGGGWVGEGWCYERKRNFLTLQDNAEIFFLKFIKLR